MLESKYAPFPLNKKKKKKKRSVFYCNPISVFFGANQTQDNGPGWRPATTICFCKVYATSRLQCLTHGATGPADAEIVSIPLNLKSPQLLKGFSYAGSRLDIGYGYLFFLDVVPSMTERTQNTTKLFVQESSKRNSGSEGAPKCFPEN